MISMVTESPVATEIVMMTTTALDLKTSMATVGGDAQKSATLGLSISGKTVGPVASCRSLSKENLGGIQCFGCWSRRNFLCH